MRSNCRCFKLRLLLAGSAPDCSGHGHLPDGQERCSQAHDALGCQRAAGLLRAETHHPTLHALQHPQGTSSEQTAIAAPDFIAALGASLCGLLGRLPHHCRLWFTHADAAAWANVQGLLAAMQKRVAKRQVSLDAAAAEAAAALAANHLTKNNEKVKPRFHDELAVSWIWWGNS